MRATLTIASAALVALAASAPAPAAPPPCRPHVSFGVLPTWARTGFSDPRPRLPHVVGRDGSIAALVFGYPLLSPPSATRSNKILWVARVSPQSVSDLRISARRMERARAVGPPVRRVVHGGPGPSIIDLPAAGCWRLTLRWLDRSDSLDLVYRR
jgi:hypothetical protein